ncbi:MAG TPA: hypothetical protein PLK64_10220 [Dermatophilaceae bacterium]|nr:hypothetical protein [Dermatophilaceae bacterium]
MTYTPYHADWRDRPDPSTPITAAAIEHIEQGIVDAHNLIAGLGNALQVAPGVVARLVGVGLTSNPDPAMLQAGDFWIMDVS